MPEGPEVAIITSQLQFLVGQAAIVDYLDDVFGKGRVDMGRILSVKKHGKLIYMEAEKGVVLNHLGMTGFWTWTKTKHSHACIRTKSHTLYFDDQRRFGELSITDCEGLQRRLSAIGPDVLSPEFTLEVWRDIIGKYKGRTRVCEFLMNQKYIAGIGNYLRAEILYKAQLHPFALVPKGAEADKLYHAIREVTQDALRRGGNSVSHYRDIDGRRGFYQPLIYKRERDPKNNVVIAERVNNRTLYWVPAVQTHGSSRDAKR